MVSQGNDFGLPISDFEMEGSGSSIRNPQSEIRNSLQRSAVTLYPYQRRWAADRSKFKIGLMARQSGKTFTATFELVDDCLEQEARGQKSRWVILSRGERQAREAMEEGVKRHLAAYKAAFESLEYEWEPAVKALEVALPGGSRITALPSNPDTARGFSANLLLDEFAFHKDSRKIWQAVFPIVSKPGLKLRIVSTPNGKSNKFYELMTDQLRGQALYFDENPSKSKPDPINDVWSRHRTDIYQAVADGLPRNIEELKAGINDPDSWAQEYECIFIDETTAYITYDMITACEDEAAAMEVGKLGAELYMGVDIGRKRDLTVIWLWEKVGDVFWTRMVRRLFRETFATQREILFTYLPFVRRCCIDATGLGMQLAEEAVMRFGSRAEAITFTAAVKEDLAVTLRRRFEDRQVRIPGDREIREDIHSVKKYVTVAGNVRFDAERTEAGHADHFWAAALGVHAGNHAAGPIEYETVRRRAIFEHDEEDGNRSNGTYETDRTHTGFAQGAW